jgi:hypothetical protein
VPTYQATAQISNGTLSVTRPHPSTDAVDDVIDSLVWTVRDADSPVTSVGVTIVTSDTGSATPPPAAQEPIPGTEDSPGPDPASAYRTAAEPVEG